MKFRYLVVPAYLTAAFLIIFPLGDALLSVLPLRPGLAGWRFGAVGVLTSALLSPLLGLLMAVGVAAASDHVKTLRVLSVMGLVVAAGLLVASVLFFLDAVEVRSQVQAPGNLGFTVAAIQGGGKQLLMAVLALSLGLGGWKTASRIPPKKERTTRAPLGTE